MRENNSVLVSSLIGQACSLTKPEKGKQGKESNKDAPYEFYSALTSSTTTTKTTTNANTNINTKNSNYLNENYRKRTRMTASSSSEIQTGSLTGESFSKLAGSDAFSWPM